MFITSDTCTVNIHLNSCCNFDKSYFYNQERNCFYFYQLYFRCSPVVNISHLPVDALKLRVQLFNLEKICSVFCAVFFFFLYLNIWNEMSFIQIWAQCPMGQTIQYNLVRKLFEQYIDDTITVKMVTFLKFWSFFNFYTFAFSICMFSSTKSFEDHLDKV